MRDEAVTPLALFGGIPTLSLDAMPGPHYRWPPITEESVSAVVGQLHESVSIKDRSGIIAELEDSFKSYYGRRYALCTNSGTAALFCAYDALGLGLGDEVLCPDYTWFATVSPLAYVGATPVFIDCDENFNLDPDLLAAHLTPRTRAVVVTHMWGMPCDMERIAAFCRHHGLYLIEDCSHAHGAMYQGRPIGSHADVAMFSLQAAKLVAAGEGGVLLFDDQNLYARANLHGQYNKRCAQEVPPKHPARQFWQSGFGLKQRIHPLGASLAVQQFRAMPQRLAVKRRFAGELLDTIRKYAFLHTQEGPRDECSWYAIAFTLDEKAADISTREFVEALHAEGLIEFDVPTLTGPIGDLPLFQNLNGAIPRLYPKPRQVVRNCPRSSSLREKVVILPVWANEADDQVVSLYRAGLEKVCRWVEASMASGREAGSATEDACQR